MLSQFASDFTLDLGDVVGYIDQIQRKIWCEVGRQIVGMNFQTHSSINTVAPGIPVVKNFSRNILYFMIIFRKFFFPFFTTRPSPEICSF